MSKDMSRTFGRGQALQRVMAQSLATMNVIEIRMENYTNEKIMQVLETLAQHNEVGPLAENMPSSNVTLPLEDGELKAHGSFESERKYAEPSTSNAKIKHKDQSTIKLKIPGQFSFKEEDFPPL